MIWTKSYDDLYVLHSDLEKSIISLCCYFPVRLFRVMQLMNII